MTTFINRLALIAGFVAMTGTAAFAQQLQGNVPFEFTAAGKSMPAGKYEIARLGGHLSGWLVKHVDTNRRTIVLANSEAHRPESESEKATLVFQCSTDNECGLKSLFRADSKTGYEFPVRLKSVDPGVRIASVRLVAAD